MAGMPSLKTIDSHSQVAKGKEIGNWKLEIEWKGRSDFFNFLLIQNSKFKISNTH
jgi:hypothetical protein